MLKASELIEKLQRLVEEYGDHYVYGFIDHEWVEDVEYVGSDDILGQDRNSHFMITDG